MSFGFKNLFQSSSQPAKPSVRRLSAADAVRMARDGGLTLIDVRDPREINGSGKARGAICIPLVRLQQLTDPRHPEFHPGLDPEKPVAIYCASGARSQMAASVMVGFGFVEVYNLGGYRAWQSAGGACER
ncbi:MAG: sulfurtransferase [Rhodobacteraceae bacterium]|nr:sulfurtransferase [Paracoccaceae bacterium]